MAKLGLVVLLLLSVNAYAACDRGHDDPTCTAANGRSDAKAMAVEGKLGFQTWGGPAGPQDILRIIGEEYKKAGLIVWWTGDNMPSEGQHQYNEAFNQAMEEAIAVRYGPDYLAKVRARIDKRMKAADAARKRQK